MRVLFVRHGESYSQFQKDVVIGRSPEFSLTNQGQRQAHELGLHLRRMNIAQIFSSTCLRAAETAEILSLSLKIPMQKDELLDERSQGDFEKRKKAEVYSEKIINRIHANQLTWKPPGGESLRDVGDRITLFLKSKSRRRKDSSVLIVTHLMVLWSVFYLCTKCRHAVLPRLIIENCGLMEIDFKFPDQFDLIRWNHSFSKSFPDESR
jgi:broad specificity phosphatase PhoE